MDYSHIIKEHALREEKDWVVISKLRTLIGEDIFWPLWNEATEKEVAPKRKANIKVA